MSLLLSVVALYTSTQTNNLNGEHSWLKSVNDAILSADLLFSRAIDLDTNNTPYISIAEDAFGFAMTSGDFNNDGLNDLVVALPGYDFNPSFGVIDNGAVVIFYGSNHSILDNTHRLIQTLIIDLEGNETGDFFGWSLTSGDYNNDGYDDLVVGIPYEDITIDPSDPGNTSYVDAGAFHLYRGSATGLPTGSTYFNDDQFYHIDTNPWGGSLIQNHAHFGQSLSTGDYNGDGFDDLAVGAPDHDISGLNGPTYVDAGIVVVYYGRVQPGFATVNRRLLSQFESNITGAAEGFDLFGRSMASGDFNHDGYDDLAIGVPYEDYFGVEDAGIVQVFYGENSGIQSNDVIWGQRNLSNITAEVGDLFGLSLAVGNFNGDNYDDLLVGSPREGILVNNTNIEKAGAVHAIYGSSSGITSAGNQTIHQGIADIFGAPEFDDQFGLVLTTSDINLDGYDEAIIGVPYEDAGATDSGINYIIFGSANGIDSTDNLHYSSSDANELMGFSLAAGNFGEGQSVVFGIPGNESSDGDENAGSIFQLVYENPYLIFKDGFESNGK